MKRFSKTLVMFALAGSGMAAHAGNDGKMYTGTNCNLENDTYGIEYNNLTGAVSNIRTGGLETRFVVCPIVKDKVSSTSFAEAHVWVKNQHPTLRVECTLTSLYSNLNSSASPKRYVRSTGYSNSWVRLSFGSGSLHTKGEALIRCTIPPKYNGRPSSVSNYYFVER